MLYSENRYFGKYFMHGILQRILALSLLHIMYSIPQIPKPTESLILPSDDSFNRFLNAPGRTVLVNKQVVCTR